MDIIFRKNRLFFQIVIHVLDMFSVDAYGYFFIYLFGKMQHILLCPFVFVPGLDNHLPIVFLNMF